MESRGSCSIYLAALFAAAACIVSAASASAQPKDAEPAASGEIEKITQCLYEALKISGYVKPGNDAVSEKKVRRLLELAMGLVRPESFECSECRALQEQNETLRQELALAKQEAAAMRVRFGCG